MANKFRSVWLIGLLVAAGVIIFFLSLGQNKSADQGVVLNDILSQKPRAAAAENITPPVKNIQPPSPAAQAAILEAKVADPVPAMAIVTTPENGHEAGFSIQVYSFQDKARAESALNVLKKTGYQAYMIMSDLGEKGTWYRVRVGGIPDEATAEKLLNEIRKSYNSGFIVKPKK